MCLKNRKHTDRRYRCLHQRRCENHLPRQQPINARHNSIGCNQQKQIIQKQKPAPTHPVSFSFLAHFPVHPKFIPFLYQQKPFMLFRCMVYQRPQVKRHPGDLFLSIHSTKSPCSLKGLHHRFGAAKACPALPCRFLHTLPIFSRPLLQIIVQGGIYSPTPYGNILL